MALVLKIINKPKHNRLVYAFGFPHRDNFLAKEDCQVAWGTTWPRFRRTVAVIYERRATLEDDDLVTLMYLDT